MALRWRALIPILALFLLAWWSLGRATPPRSEGRFDSAIPYVRFQPVSPGAGAVLLVHGLSASKEFMQTAAAAFADAGFDAYAIDLPGHGDSPGAFSSEASLAAIRRALDLLPADTVVLGHSLGAGLLVDLAAHRNMGKLILVSPPPLVVEPIRSPRALVITGGLDAPRIAEFGPVLAEQSGTRTAWWEFNRAGHSSMLFTPRELRSMVAWAGGEPAAALIERRRLWWSLMAASGFAGPLLVLRGPKPTRPRGAAAPPSLPEELGGRVLALGGAVLLAGVWAPFEWLGLFAVDYLVSLLFAAGLLLWLWRGRPVRPSWSGALWGAAAAAYVLLMLGVVASPFVHVIPSGDSWLLATPLALAAFPWILYDEATLRSLAPWWRRWGMVLTVWALVWAACVTGVLLVTRDRAFLVLILHFIVIFRILLWWMAGVVRRVSDDAFAAALFAAVVQGCLFAALFARI